MSRRPDRQYSEQQAVELVPSVQASEFQFSDLFEEKVNKVVVRECEMQAAGRWFDNLETR